MKKTQTLNTILIFNFLISRFSSRPPSQSNKRSIILPPGYCYMCSRYNKRVLYKKAVSESCLRMWNSCIPRGHSWSLENVSFSAFWAYIILALCHCSVCVCSAYISAGNTELWQQTWTEGERKWKCHIKDVWPRVHNSWSEKI